MNELPDASLYDINLSLSADRLSIDGDQKVYYTNTENVPLDKIYFYLYSNIVRNTIKVSNIRVNGEEVNSKYFFNETLLDLTLPDVLEPNSEIIIEMDFKINLITEMNIYGVAGNFDGVLFLDGFYPVIPVYDQKGWNLDEIPKNGDKTFLDVSYYQVSITAPKDFIFVTTGSEVTRTIIEENQSIVFAAGPCRDFFIVGSEDFLTMDSRIGQTSVNSYIITTNSQDNAESIETALDAIEFFNSLFSVYPYTELDIVSLPLPDYILGIEYPGVIGINPNVYSQGTLLEATIVHEIGHQWFYNIVGNDQINEPWLDEAIVQYITGLYFFDTYGQGGWEGYYESWISRWERINSFPISIGMPSDYYTSREYSAVIYGRGPIMIDELAKEMGKESFTVFLSDYYENNKWGITCADIFCEMAQEYCNCRLDTFFNEWLFDG